MMSSGVRSNPVKGGGLSSGRRFKNSLMAGLMVLATLIVLTPLLLIFYFLIVNGIQSINWDTFTQLPKPEGETGGGFANAIVGSVIIVGMATVMGVIVGIGGGVMISEYREHPMVPAVRLISDVLSGIPAIVMGLVAYTLIIAEFKTFRGFAASLALGFIMIPIVVRTTEEVLKLVPQTVREAGLALGLPKWRVIYSIILPAARSGIITGVMLAISRVSGEAAPLLFTALGSQFWQLNPFSSLGMAALPLEIYNRANSPFPSSLPLAYAASLILVLMVFVTTLVARIATRKK
ncbi:phosphate ABC transporter permease PstA [Deinococcus roseus]|uniref:Phosphate transport system permease protein PstA n=1 Tax=Deinococcus roseus TaxID=392414 RepID=A0ABQ2D8I0_9DEIO|nr:phosphate ABC transporter permease PstA [Deinococcus roseus]GGJ49338.1 phosphate transport system permease protein PstA [Deinococcus roseus]